jgi:hypothetical protein
MTQVVTAKNFLKTLDSLRDQVKAALSGYREQVYGLMAKAWLVVLLLRKDKTLRRKFVRRAKLKVAAKGKTALNVVTEVMAYVMGAKTASKRKLAWKRGRVIEFLHSQGIKIAKIAAEIKSRGGIEAVFKQAVKQQPRRDKGSVGTKTGAKKSKPLLMKMRDKQDRDTADSDESDIGARSPVTERNDKLVVMKLPMLIKLSDQDTLDELPIGSRVRIVATRTNQQGATIEVNRIKKLKPAVQKLDDDDDWD